MYSVAQQQQQNYFQRIESQEKERKVDEAKQVRVVHAQFNSPINLYSEEKIAETLNQVLTTDSYTTSTHPVSDRWNPQQERFKTVNQGSDFKKKAPLPPPKPKTDAKFQQQEQSFLRQDSSAKSSVDFSNRESFGEEKVFSSRYRQSSQEVIEEYEQFDDNEYQEYNPPQVHDSRAFGVNKNQIQDNRVFGSNQKPPPPQPVPKDRRVFASNYRPPTEESFRSEPRPAVRQLSREDTNQQFQNIEETTKMTKYHDQRAQELYQRQLENQRQQQYEEQFRRQQIEEQKRRHLEEQQRRHLETERRRLEEERELQGSPNLSDGEQRLNLHQGSVVQFPSRIPDPKHKLPDGSHLADEERFVQLHAGTVCQFPSHLPDPNQKLIEGSHLGEEKERVYLHGGTVLQFPTEVPNYSQKLPEAPHMRDLEEMEHLHLKQGSVLQFPKEVRETKFDGFHPPKEALEEALPPAESVRYNQLLPSEARRQQAYLVHQNQQPIKLLSEVSSAPGSPSSGRRNKQNWPPRSLSQERHSPFTLPGGGKKSFLWPPPKPEYHRSFQELPPPDAGQGPTADVWHPMESPSQRSYRQPVINRKRAVWPPPSPRTLIKQSSLPETGKCKKIEFEEHMLYHAGCNVPICYRAPPGTQFYNPYESL